METKNKKKIVVVDDDLEIHDLITAFFRPRDFEVIGFLDAADAIQESLVTGGTWDVLLTDYHFANMLSVDFTQSIKESLPQLPIILITPLDKAETALQAVEKGADDIICKPIQYGQLLAAVDRALNFKTIKGDLSKLRQIVGSSATKSAGLIGRSPKFLAAVDVARRVATSSANILISGESGTGKEVFAKFIHNNSKCSKGPFTAINCSSIPENLLESELFGHGKGSFTGAVEKRIGLFEAAENGTLFLDEIGDLSLPLQAKLLRVLQEHKIKRVGENHDRPINCRFVSATHKDLVQEVNEGRFREDLFFRLNVIPIKIPPLRERAEDLIPLAESFLKRFSLSNDSKVKTFSKSAIRFLLDSPWRGNVRELENAIERAVVLSEGSEITLESFMPSAVIDITDQSPKPNQDSLSDSNTFCVRFSDHLPVLDDVINQYINFAVLKNHGARDKTAKLIGIDRKTLYKRLQVSSPLPH